jgi:hypothetical protein
VPLSVLLIGNIGRISFYYLRILLFSNPDKPVIAKRTCPPVPCGGDLSAFGRSRFIGEPKIFATKAQRHEGFYFVIRS